MNRFRDSSVEEQLRLRASTAESVHSANQEGLARQVEAVYLRQLAQYDRTQEKVFSCF